MIFFHNERDPFLQGGLPLIRDVEVRRFFLLGVLRRVVARVLVNYGGGAFYRVFLKGSDSGDRWVSTAIPAMEVRDRFVGLVRAREDPIQRTLGHSFLSYQLNRIRHVVGTYNEIGIGTRVLRVDALSLLCQLLRGRRIILKALRLVDPGNMYRFRRAFGFLTQGFRRVRRILMLMRVRRVARVSISFFGLYSRKRQDARERFDAQGFRLRLVGRICREEEARVDVLHYSNA